MNRTILTLMIFSFTVSCDWFSRSEKFAELEQTIVRKDSLNSYMTNRLFEFEKTINQLKDENSGLKSALSRTIFNNRDSTYLLFGLLKTQDDSEYVWTWPLAQINGSQISRPNFKYLKYIIDSTMTVYNMLYSNNHIGYLYNYSNYNDDGFRLKYLIKPKSYKQSNSEMSFFSLATTKFISKENKTKRRHSNQSESKLVRKLALGFLTERNVNITNANKIEIKHLEILKPIGMTDSLIVTRFDYEEEINSNFISYSSFILKEYNSKPDSFLYKYFGKSDPIRERGSGAISFFDIFDYDNNGIDEIILVRYGYELRDVMFFKIVDGKLVNFYTVPTSIT